MAPKNDPRNAPLKRTRTLREINTDEEEELLHPPKRPKLPTQPQTPTKDESTGNVPMTPESVDPRKHRREAMARSTSSDEGSTIERMVLPCEDRIPPTDESEIEDSDPDTDAESDDDECQIRVYITAGMRKKLMENKGFTLKFV